MSNGDISCPIWATNRRWTSGGGTKILHRSDFSNLLRLSHDGTISPLESNGLIKSKETVISLDYVRPISSLNHLKPSEWQLFHHWIQEKTLTIPGHIHTGLPVQRGQRTHEGQWCCCWGGQRIIMWTCFRMRIEIKKRMLDMVVLRGRSERIIMWTWGIRYCIENVV